MINKKVAIIGCGNLGKSILEGIIESEQFPQENIIATKRNIEVLQEEYKELDITITNDNIYAIKNADIILFALKPHNTLVEMDRLKHYFDPEKHIIVSMATGVTIKSITETIKIEIPIFRAMPNTAADVNASVTCLCSNTSDIYHYKTVKYLFDLMGVSIIISEELMEAATILGACGIAFVLRFIRAMTQGGIQIGFDAKTASSIVNQTVMGAAKLLIDRNEHPEYEIDKVTTPKGCTIAGLNEMEHNGFSSALIKAIVTSYKEIEK